LEKKVYYLEWDSIISPLHQHPSIRYKEILIKILTISNKLIKITIKSNNHGDKNMKLNGYQVRTNTIFKFHPTVLLTLLDRNRDKLNGMAKIFIKSIYQPFQNNFTISLRNIL
jgi:hypothetical protein